MTSKEIKEVEKCLTMNNVEITLKVIKELARIKSQIAIKFLFDISNNKEWIIKDAAINALLSIKYETLIYINSIENIKNENIDMQRKIKYIKQYFTPAQLRSFHKKNITY